MHGNRDRASARYAFETLAIGRRCRASVDPKKRPRLRGNGEDASSGRDELAAMSEALALNELTPVQRERILERVREGRSLRSIEAETGHRRETIGRYAR